MSQICSKFSFSYFQPILPAIFITIETPEVESIPEFYTLAINKKKLIKSNFHFLPFDNEYKKCANKRQRKIKIGDKIRKSTIKFAFGSHWPHSKFHD